LEGVLANFVDFIDDDDWVFALEALELFDEYSRLGVNVCSL